MYRTTFSTLHNCSAKPLISPPSSLSLTKTELRVRGHWGCVTVLPLASIWLPMFLPHFFSIFPKSVNIFKFQRYSTFSEKFVQHPTTIYVIIQTTTSYRDSNWCYHNRTYILDRCNYRAIEQLLKITWLRRVSDVI